MPGFIGRRAPREDSNWIKWEAKWRKPCVRPLTGLQSSENSLASSPLLVALNMSLWPPGEPAGLPVWLWGEARASLPWLCGCRWLMHTPVSSAASHLSGHGVGEMLVDRTGFYQETQVSRKTMKEIWIDQILHPSRKQNWVQIFSRLSFDKSSGHHIPDACLWEHFPLCSHTELKHEGAGLPASL